MSDFPQRIVYVDDDQQMRQLVRDSLESGEDESILVTCGGGQELIARFRELQPDLIILDVIMPDMDGLEVIKTLSEDPDKKDVPIVLLTGKTKLTMENDYKALGAIGIIHKPFDALEFPTMIKAIWMARSNADLP